MFNGFSHSVKGASHEVSGKVCQDSSGHKVTENYAVAVVADGHGSKKHFRSNIGSRCAVEATMETVSKFYENIEELEANLPKNHKLIIRNIEKQIISNWNERVLKHLLENPVTDAEKEPFTPEEFEKIPPESYYGTTLVAAVTGKTYSFGIQIGDGSLVAMFEDGETLIPMEYNEANPANITSSMCNSNAASMFDSFYVENRPVLAMYASTDGLYTSFGSDVDFLDYHTIITGQLIDILKFDPSIQKNLEKRSHFGTEDDISLACVFNDEKVHLKIDLINEQIAENKKRAQTRKIALQANMQKQKQRAVTLRAEELHSKRS